MSLEDIKNAIRDKTVRCPQCDKPIQQYDKYVEMTTDVWDGAGDAKFGTGADKVTLICGNGKCAWKERTEYWRNYLQDAES